ncbi:MAG: c-type cytochrome [Gemmatimonadota bacterium]
MKKLLIALAVGSSMALASGVAGAQDAKKGQAEAKESGCLTCHDVAKKKIGPAYKTVAAEMKKSGANVDKLVADIKAKHSDLKANDGQLKDIAAWILSM